MKFSPKTPTRTSRNQTGVISEKLDDLKIALKPALGAAFSDSSKISCQEWQQFHDKVTKENNKMGKKSGTTFQKREKEKDRIQRQKDKETRRLEAKERKATAITVSEGEDPDIAGIRPGPQPLPEQWE